MTGGLLAWTLTVTVPTVVAPSESVAATSKYRVAGPSSPAKPELAAVGVVSVTVGVIGSPFSSRPQEPCQEEGRECVRGGAEVAEDAG